MQNLILQGHTKSSLQLPEQLQDLIRQKAWQELDKELSALVEPGGLIYQTLAPYKFFEKIEYITNVRDASNPWEEDGIWHDDGSRVLAFSLSLNLDPSSLSGGEIGFRKKGENEISLIPVQPYGELIIFATGIWGWEHKVYQVKNGVRVVMAGWCS